VAWRIKSGNSLSYYSDGLKIVGKYLCTCARAYEYPSVPTLKVFYFLNSISHIPRSFPLLSLFSSLILSILVLRYDDCHYYPHYYCHCITNIIIVITL
jgi:hypothetical protein